MAEDKKALVERLFATHGGALQAFIHRRVRNRSDATDLAQVVRETLSATGSERQGRISDGEDGGSLEQKKREGYF